MYMRLSCESVKKKLCVNRVFIVVKKGIYFFLRFDRYITYKGQ